MSDVPLIASSRPLFGHGLNGKDADFACMESFSTPAAIEQYLEAMVGAGVRSLITPLDERLLSVLRRRMDLQIEVIPLMPNVMGLVRDATEYGMMGAGFRLVWRLGLGTVIPLGLRSMPKALRVLRRDFPTMLSILFDLELSLFRAFHVRRALLNPQITDLLLAFENKEFFHQYESLLRGRFCIEPGLATSNFGTLARKLEEWQSTLNLVMTPVNAEGWQMKPNQNACEAALSSPRYSVIAEKISIENPPTREALKHVAAFPAVKEIAVDIANWDTFNRIIQQP